MTLILLIRHALPAWEGNRLYGRSPGLHLSEPGRAQAAELAERLKDLPLSAVYTSPLERCVETAEPVTAGRSVRPEVLEDLQEIDFGGLTGRTFRQLGRTALWRRLHVTPSSIRFPGGESLVDAQVRSVRAVDRMAAGSPRRTVAAITHADVIRLALAHYAGIHLDLFQRLLIAPASVSAIQLGGIRPQILRVNDTGSLDDVLPPPAGRSRARGARRRMRG